jgi:dynein heavy chain 1
MFAFFFERFLRHCPLIYVDYPGEISLKQIYGTFNRAMLKKFSNIKSFGDALTNAMVEFFLMTQVRFERIRSIENKMIYLGTIYC